MTDAPVRPTESDFTEFGAVEVQKLSRFQQLTGSFLPINWNAIPHTTHRDEVDITDGEVRWGARNAQHRDRGAAGNSMVLPRQRCPASFGQISEKTTHGV